MSFDKLVEGAQGGRAAAHEYVEMARKDRCEVSEAAEPIGEAPGALLDDA